MSPNCDIAVFGGDKRQVYIAQALAEKGYPVCTFQLLEAVQGGHCTELHKLGDMFHQCNVLIGPIPLTKNVMPAEQLTAIFSRLLQEEHVLIGGVMPPALAQFCKREKIACYDLMQNEKIAILNAVATAEGAIMEAIQNSVINLHGSNCLVLGYGRCARVLAEKLKGLSARVTVSARGDEALAYAQAAGMQPVHLSGIKEILPHSDFVFNTIPALILDKCCLERLNPLTVIIDIASAPGGVDYDYAGQKKLNAKLCLGLPGKIAPKISADILTDQIITLLKARSD
ncbi:MAG TPA: dipicolinate synthase subunit DpsA [Clostridia bacterium]|nr:dipicolinate synthase subunit DpsA [Clostridia bacterium]